MSDKSYDEVDASKINGDVNKAAIKVNTSSAKPSSNSVLGQYKIRKNGRRLAIVINIKNFSKSAGIPSRQFHDVDEAVITTMLHDTLGFEIFPKHDCERTDLHDLFSELSGWDYKDVDAVAIVLMSYGNNKSIYTSDGQEIEIRELLKNLKGKNCPQLVGKPKIVFINAGVWEEEVDEVEYDEVDGQKSFISDMDVEKPEKKLCVPVESDFIYVYSPVTTGHQRRGRIEQGNIFLEALSEMCLKLHGEALEFCDLLTRTNRQVAYRMSSNADIPARPCFFLSTFTKELYLTAKT